jgi:hypothetical protein
MTATAEKITTLADAEAHHFRAMEHNRDVGVVAYETQEKQSDEVWEVTDGYKYLPGGVKLGPGNRFHPTVRQIEQTARGKGGLLGKARELTGAEYRDVKRQGKTFSGADIGLRAIAMTEPALQAALAAQLDEQDFADIQGEGNDGRITKAQVDRLVQAKAGGDV